MHAFHWKLPPKGLLDVKKLWKFRFLDHFSKAKTEEPDQEDWRVSDAFGTISLAQLHIIWKWAHLFHSNQPPKLLLVAKKLSFQFFTGFRLLFQNKNGAVRPKKLSLSDKFGMLKVATETSFSGKKSENLTFLGYFFRSKIGGVWLLFFS